MKNQQLCRINYSGPQSPDSMLSYKEVLLEGYYEAKKIQQELEKQY